MSPPRAGSSWRGNNSFECMKNRPATHPLCSAPMRRATVLAFVLALAPASASASPEDLFGYGARSSAMGGTGAAAAEGYETAFANPALASRARRPRLTLGLIGATFDVHADGEGLAGRVSGRSSKGLVIGGDIPVPFGGALRDRVGFALGFYTPSDVLVRGRILYPEKAQFPLLSDRAQCLTVRAGFGIDLGRGLRVGAGFGALAQIMGTVVVATDATGRVGSRVEDQLVATYAPTVGASWEHALAGGTLRIGSTFRGKLDARFAVSIDATKLSTLNIPVFNIAGLAQYDPAELALEAAWERGPWRFAAGATYKHWSDYAGLLEPTILCPPEEPDCAALRPPKLSFSSTVVPRLGVERVFAIGRGRSATLRVGWFFEPTPSPARLPESRAFDPTTHADADVPTRFFDAHRHVFTAGGGLRVRDVTIDTFAQVHVLHPRDVGLAAGGPSGAESRASLSGVVLSAGLLVGVAF